MARPGMNPYARPAMRDGEAPDPTNEQVFAGPGAYAVTDAPDSSDPEYQDGAYASELRRGGSPDGSKLPSDIRIGTREEPENDPNDREYNRRQWSNKLQRHSVEDTATGWTVQQHKAGPPAQNPMWTQERMPIRPTATNSPLNYQFRRPWHFPRNIAEIDPTLAVEERMHFSMADHRRVYPIMGMKPQGRIGVNTYRSDPQPWDDELFITPPASEVTRPDFSGNRSYRL